jgi:tetratricopeptide (TPR) repeat protein
LISRLGAGAMGEVWRALDTRLERTVAVKLLPSAFAADPERRARMQREARAAAQVGHASVVIVHDVGSDGGEDYLVMELVEGRTLADHLRKGPPSLAEALRIISSVTGALAAAHAKGILHRDVKGANVMLAEDGTVKVLDFGLAKLRGADASVPPASAGSPAPAAGSPPAGPGAELALLATMPSGGGSLEATQEGTMLGTPAYFSPEQVQGRLPDEKSEVFSAGILAYEVLTGHSPFVGTDLPTLTRSITDGQIVPPSGPPGVVDTVMRALARDRKQRFADMASFHAAIEAARARLGRRRRWPLALAAIVVAALLGVVLALVLARGGAATRPPSAVDHYLAQALDEWNLFYNDKAHASLTAAARIAPTDPRAEAYLVLTDVSADPARNRAAAASAKAHRAAAPSARDRALVDAAIRLTEAGPAAARAPLAAFVGKDAELTFWDAELAYRAQAFGEADRGYRSLVAAGESRFLGRIYDHEVAVLLTLGDTAAAVRLGAAYARAFPAEADALGVHATALAAAGQTEQALALASAALELHDSEDSLAGLGKVLALRGQLALAGERYRASIASAPPWRRPLRRAALGAIDIMEGRVDDARAVTAPCMPGGAEAAERTAAVCVAIAALADVSLTDVAVATLERLALAPPPEVPYGEPAKLARVLRARARLDSAATCCDAHLLAELDELLVGADELFVGYHVPFLATYAVRLRAQARILAGEHGDAVALLAPVIAARPGDVPSLLLLARAQAGSGDRAGALVTVNAVLAAWRAGDSGAAYLRQARRMRVELGTL